jgi:putative NADH-flavin reductase
MEKLVRASNVNWTIIRPPWLKDHPPTGKYKLGINTHLKRPFSISRADLARYICDIIDKPGTFRSIIEIAY